MATWPATLPQKFLQSGFNDAEPDLFIVTQMDAGPPKVRRRFTANSRPMAGEMNLTVAQKGILKAFYRDHGGGKFSFPDPDGGSALSVIFAAAPSYGSAVGLYIKVTLKFTVLP